MAHEKLWGGRFSEPTDQFVEEFTASIDFDKRLYHQDIRGSIAHARMLGKQGILPMAEVEKIVAGLQEVLARIEAGKFDFSVALEDIHMNIEARLTEKIGEAGKRLHTGRSRNDQVALDIRLYLRDEIVEISAYLDMLVDSLIYQAEANLGVIMPGYTHLQTAQPILFSHHMMAYVEMFTRDKGRMEDCLRRMNVLPLGAGALAGTTFPIDREHVAELLDFPGVTRNSLDSVSDRDFALEFMGASSILMMHLSRFSEELILWSTSEFKFVELTDSFCTGSSIMPQKKNPDVPELVRGKTGRVYGNLMALLTVMKALPLAYNKDMQEDKEPLFDTIDTVKGSLKIFADMVREMRINAGNMRAAAAKGFSTATDVADYLVRQGMPFRDAHEVVGKTVAYCIANGKDLPDLTMDEWQGFSDKIGEDIFDAITLEASVNARVATGGTALERVKAEIERAKVGR
ncbi:argininosuccinate lyase [Geobacter sulfurreducens]|uniref:Argininosuccinate lyase n=1 Tax=Geobacter sulfurreducens (strain ATCC 51573 / DSM 12127 / PCA) TaxID=243231 RepID=ARLY_GEOSL|nr:argininosuccinate lyase [Geobacter sulfurreducens]Q74GT9.1 RecName: Full=Argininosuccinate lyase; Short=ASAL; AltName: Full=Arginosuccinase [Geobacter sulfurreducens PCA]AAR33491.1 argininosuccinate lyase [Geobacter sulfurreducens PCA]QVW35434.1 argininosuccinate lyase [Geobacter sulfurreducens]UAC04257.1 argininosuccinate lyase [Geobacter sulfurreducens]UTG92875.1 argininosuccinate lyase [Geobacter sulfurreducens]HBB69282.1 argininosuccinate lyase [Geobacter sulfurreducens]